MELCLQGQDLYSVVGGSKTTPLLAIDVMALCKWKVRIGKAMLAIKTIVEEEEILEHIRKVTMSKEA